MVRFSRCSDKCFETEDNEWLYEWIGFAILWSKLSIVDFCLITECDDWFATRFVEIDFKLILFFFNVFSYDFQFCTTEGSVVERTIVIELIWNAISRRLQRRLPRLQRSGTAVGAAVGGNDLGCSQHIVGHIQRRTLARRVVVFSAIQEHSWEQCQTSDVLQVVVVMSFFILVVLFLSELECNRFFAAQNDQRQCQSGEQNEAKTGQTARATQSVTPRWTDRRIPTTLLWLSTYCWKWCRTTSTFRSPEVRHLEKCR